MVKVLVENVSKKYGDTYALREVNMVAEDGALVCILGPSGSGEVYSSENNSWASTTRPGKSVL
jgi:ABC-type proline/glycine betaine transport system ATPase subunit